MPEFEKLIRDHMVSEIENAVNEISEQEIKKMRFRIGEKICDSLKLIFGPTFIQFDSDEDHMIIIKIKR